MVNLVGKRSKKLKVGRKLPPGYHKLPGEEYDIRKSEVVQWLIQQPSIQEFVWDQFKQSGDVSYDQTTGKWRGVDYDKLCPHRDEWDDCPDCRH
ncbi:hypothetical protein [Brevibacillus laterosporus]|uniref:Uncharacterized protein n=1 Tax=Brevibacillus laterosporus TaxID=1465 RepID=A0AAP3DD26_BRELA|nr:hypothetical protein [Brevibacillus laterosporus]MCR8978710.1 hypothetical protein [Brevibacillus laterosporus]MCZ0805866.1 hypothetical protein [Brevibacillus laterosporus]MCZ0824368.1 hypothetical protein [Brevibacillus laterosporus]MCZ0848272.1 hypothetical protein [Brevibacillus laterosporus]